MSRYLVTGGAGFVGSHIVETILREGRGEVVVYDNLSSGYERNISAFQERITFVEGDIRDRESLDNVMPGVDIVFHNAAFVSAFDSIHRPEETRAINVDGTRNVLESAKKKGVKRVVLASSAAIYGTKAALPNNETFSPDPISPYAESKFQNEIDARRYAEEGLETVCLRYFNVFGPRQDPSSEYSGVISRFVDCFKSGRQPVIYGDGSQTRDFVSVTDVARANLLASESANCGGGEIINIGKGEEISLLDLVAALNHATNLQVKPDMAPWRDGDIRRSVADVSLAKELLGFEAQITFQDAIQELINM